MHDFQEVFSQVNWLQALKTFLQIVIICYGVLWIWRRIIGTQAERLVKGVLVLVAICVLSYALGFELVTGLLQRLIPIAVMAVLVIFQPEIRRGLGYLGRMKTFKLDFALPNPEAERSRHDMVQIIAAVRELSRTRVGALIVIEPPQGERDYLSPGTEINADVSSTLLLTIFFPKSPLHDGAVIIRQHKIVAAGVILPMTTDPKLSYRYGTRHRAAIGLSEIYDGLCIVVSEETGSISAASRGMLARYNTADDLANPLSYIYSLATSQTAASPLQAFLNLVARKTEEPAPRPDIEGGALAGAANLEKIDDQAGEPAAVAASASEDGSSSTDQAQAITARLRFESALAESGSGVGFDKSYDFSSSKTAGGDGDGSHRLKSDRQEQPQPVSSPSTKASSPASASTSTSTSSASPESADEKSGSDSVPASPPRPQLGSIEPEQAL